MASKAKRDVFAEALAAMGGAEQVARDIADFSRRCAIMSAKQREWTEQHPCKWAALAEDDELLVGDDLEDLTRKLVQAGKRRDNLVVQYLDPNPPTLIV